MLVVLPSDLKALFFMDVVMNVDYIKMYKRYNNKQTFIANSSTKISILEITCIFL